MEENNPVLFEGATEEQAEQDFKWLIDHYLDKIKERNNVDNATQSPWIEVTFTEALDFYARQLRNNNPVTDQNTISVNGQYATGIKFCNGSAVAVTAAPTENYSIHRDDWADYGDAVPQFWVKDVGLRNN